MSTELQALYEQLRRFRAAWVSRGWSWDRRFDCVASTLVFEDAAEARRLVASVLPHQFTQATLSTAPAVIAQVAEVTGGVRADQALYAAAAGRVMVYGLWWPWGGEASNISVRVGLAGEFSNDNQLDLRELFGALED